MTNCNHKVHQWNATWGDKGTYTKRPYQCIVPTVDAYIVGAVSDQSVMQMLPRTWMTHHLRRLFRSERILRNYTARSS